MKTVSERFAIDVCAVVMVLACATSLRAEKKFSTYCDNMCGDTTKCMVTCCTLTSESVGGADVITNLNCSSSVCCAHPEQSSVKGGSMVKVPPQAVDGVVGPIRTSLIGTAGLDASTIAVQSNNKNKTITLTGTVKSAAQLRQASTVVLKHANGFKVINQLTIK